MDHPPAPRGARSWVPLSGLLLLVALALPWWGIHYGIEGGGGRWELVRPFQRSGPAPAWATITSGVLVVAAALVVFVRTAGASWRHEPRAHLRDLWVATGLVALALALVALWPPANGPGVWGRLSYEGGGQVFTESSRLQVGWFLALAAAAGVGKGAWQAQMWWRDHLERPRPARPDGPSTPRGK